MESKSIPQVLEVSRLPRTVRAPRLDHKGFIRALLERAGREVYLSTGKVGTYEEAMRTMWALRDWFRRNRRDLRLEVRLEPRANGWRLWARVEPRTSTAEVAHER